MRQLFIKRAGGIFCRFCKKSFFVWFTAFLLCFFVTGLCMSKVLPGKDDEPALKEELSEIIKGGVGDNSWWNSKSKEEVRKNLSRYYTGPLLDELSFSAWEFIRKPTDWYWQVSLVRMEVLWQTGKRAGVGTVLKGTDLVTGESDEGEAEYVLEKTRQGWRIFSAEYHWPVSSERMETK